MPDNQTLAFAGLLIGWTIHISALVWWLSRQFDMTRQLVYRKSAEHTKQLFDHEKEDERRFGQLEGALQARGRRGA